MYFLLFFYLPIIYIELNALEIHWRFRWNNIQQIQMEERADKLREEVAEMIASSTTTASRLHLIDALERLCLDHLFEEEICAALGQMETADVSGYDLGTVALWFCLLRKHRYRVSPGSNEHIYIYIYIQTHTACNLRFKVSNNN